MCRPYPPCTTRQSGSVRVSCREVADCVAGEDAFRHRRNLAAVRVKGESVRPVPMRVDGRVRRPGEDRLIRDLRPAGCARKPTRETKPLPCRGWKVADRGVVCDRL